MAKLQHPDRGRNLMRMISQRRGRLSLSLFFWDEGAWGRDDFRLGLGGELRRVVFPELRLHFEVP